MTHSTALASGLVRLGIALTLCALVVLTFLLLMPGRPGPGLLPGLDKVFHFIGFLGLVLPFTTVFPRLAVAAVIVAGIYGGVIELIQPSFGRGAEWGDAIANFAGAATGAAIGRWLHGRLAARRIAVGGRADGAR